MRERLYSHNGTASVERRLSQCAAFVFSSSVVFFTIPVPYTWVVGSRAARCAFGRHETVESAWIMSAVANNERPGLLSIPGHGRGVSRFSSHSFSDLCPEPRWADRGNTNNGHTGTVAEPPTTFDSRRACGASELRDVAPSPYRIAHDTSSDASLRGTDGHAIMGWATAAAPRRGPPQPRQRAAQPSGPRSGALRAPPDGRQSPLATADPRLARMVGCPARAADSRNPGRPHERE